MLQKIDHLKLCQEKGPEANGCVRGSISPFLTFIALYQTSFYRPQSIKCMMQTKMEL